MVNGSKLAGSMNSAPHIFQIELPELEFPDKSLMVKSEMWEGVYVSDRNTPEYVYEWMKKVSQLALTKMQTLSDSVLEVVDHGKVMLYQGGQASKLHVDGITLNGRIIEYSCVVFLNKPDSGGELVFPDINLKIEPIPGRMVIFLNGFVNPHYVNDYAGERKVFTPFVAIA